MFRLASFLLLLTATIAAPAAAQLQTIPRALVLEPFASELELGTAAGQKEIDVLRAFGFAVDVYRDSAVTVPVMEEISKYAVVYMETHASVLPNGDALVLTGESDPHPYAALFGEHSLLQGFATDEHGPLYNGITGRFISEYLTSFSASSLVIINGCDVLGAPLFWRALEGKGVSTLVSWTGDIASETATAAGPFLLGRLADGETVQSALTDAESIGVDTAGPEFNYRGNGENTLKRALLAAPLPPTPTALVSTATPMPRPFHRRCTRFHFSCPNGESPSR